MMNRKDNNLLEKFARQVRQIYPESIIWAFGSRALGVASEDSDLDVCVVLNTINDDIRDSISDIAWEIGFNHDVFISTVVFSREMFEKGPASASPLVKTILEEGVMA